MPYKEGELDAYEDGFIKTPNGDVYTLDQWRAFGEKDTRQVPQKPQFSRQQYVIEALRRGLINPQAAMGILQPQTPEYAKPNPKDFTPGSFRAYMSSGDPSVLQTAPSGDEGKESREYSFKLRKEFNDNQVVKDFEEVDAQIAKLDKTWDIAQKTNKFGPVDQALVMIFNKMLDPASVVRESEFARTPEAISTWNKLKGKAEKITRGGVGLTNDERRAIVELGMTFYKTYLERMDYITDDFGNTAVEFGAMPDVVVPASIRKRLAKGQERFTRFQPKRRVVTDPNIISRLEAQ